MSDMRNTDVGWWGHGETLKGRDQKGFIKKAVTDLVLEEKEELNSAWEVWDSAVSKNIPLPKSPSGNGLGRRGKLCIDSLWR